MQDGNIHCHVDNLSRRSAKHGVRYAVATAAYNSGEKLWSESEQRHVDFGNRQDVMLSEIIAPAGSPNWVSDRASLWNKVDVGAARKDARLAKTVEAAITRDVPENQRAALLRAFAAPYVAMGCVADVAIHEDGTGNNPHVHILLTTRRLTPDGFGDKLAALDQRSFVKQARIRWADLTNHFLKQTGSALRVDHRSYKARGIGAEPTVHRGPDERERRDKREHARRVREEQTMPKPTLEERRDYPLLTLRETWPPEPAPSSDMLQPERDEHHRYWQDRRLERLEEQSRQQPDRPWFEQALDRARTEAGVEPHRERRDLREADLDRSPARERQNYDYESTVRERALAMDRTREETEAIDAVRHEPAETRRFVQDFILHGRMQLVRDQDLAGRLEQVQPGIREKLEVLRPNYRDWEHERPVLSPDRELIPQGELDRAQRRQLDDYERDEPERER
jgi:hypothetical protein